MQPPTVSYKSLPVFQIIHTTRIFLLPNNFTRDVSTTRISLLPNRFTRASSQPRFLCSRIGLPAASPGNQPDDDCKKCRPDDGPENGKRLPFNDYGKDHGKPQISGQPFADQGADKAHCNRYQATAHGITRDTLTDSPANSCY